MEKAIEIHEGKTVEKYSKANKQTLYYLYERRKHETHTLRRTTMQHVNKITVCVCEPKTATSICAYWNAL